MSAMERDFSLKLIGEGALASSTGLKQRTQVRHE
jgi:hypothetical protein